MTERLSDRIRAAYADSEAESLEAQRQLFLTLRDRLEKGEVRAAEPDGTGWRVNRFVKEGILLGFRTGVLASAGSSQHSGNYFDKETMAVRHLDKEDGVRLVPGGSSIRCGAHVAAGVTIMPPAYINIGAYVGRDAMIDSHALVGSCAQVGERVHLSAAAQIGGVLEPIGQLPVIVEDDVLVGGNCGVYEGVIVRSGAVLATGTILNASTVLFDVVHEREIRASPDAPLDVPPGAVVVPGARRLAGEFAASRGLCLQTPIIIKYRDARTDARTALEGALREEL